MTELNDFRWDVEVADISGDLACTVGYGRFTASIDGAPPAPITLRVTHVYRRENSDWKIVHRHGDFAPVDESPPAEASTT
ncbi:MAG: nuclear transport factor 2 family protein [Pseudonocardiales bacterium]|nr:nuclear transport factor 2 family protein [Pseudonocardiales bacterium]